MWLCFLLKMVIYKFGCISIMFTCSLSSKRKNMFVARLHWHAIFGDMSVSDTDTGTTHRTPVSVRSAFFFFFRFSDVAPTRKQWKKKKNKNSRFWQMDKSLLLILWYTLEWDLRNLKSETHTAQPLISLCPLRPSRALHWANRRVSELPLSLPISLSPSAWTGPSFPSLSVFRDFFFLSFICWLLWTFRLVYCGVLYL